jgi:hypothetical protein
MASIGDLPAPRPGTASFYLPILASDWTRVLELFLHPPWSPQNDEMLVAMQPVGDVPMILIEIPEENVDGALALALFLGHQAREGHLVVGDFASDARAPARNARTYYLIPRVPLTARRITREGWTDARIRGALRAAGFATAADWVAHFWADRPGVTVEVAEQAFRAWLTGPGQLPAEFAPSRNAGQ